MTPEKLELVRRLRLGCVVKLLRYRYRRNRMILTDDDAGRDDLKELLLIISSGPNAGIKMPRAIELWAPWMSPADAEWLIDDINQTPIYLRWRSREELGRLLNVSNGLREQLRVWQIAACDMTPEQALEWVREKDRARKRKQRQGSKPQANSISRTKPWLLAGFKCRRTWERHGKPNVATMSAIKLLKSKDKLATNSKPNRRKKLSMQHQLVLLEKTIRPFEGICCLRDTTAPKLSGQSCDTDKNKPEQAAQLGGIRINE